MKYENADKLSDQKFRRLTGVKRKTFAKMVEILMDAEAAKRRKGGHKSKLSVEDMLLLTLQYLREYRTIKRYKSSRAGSFIPLRHQVYAFSLLFIANVNSEYRT